MADASARRIALLCLLLAALPGCGKKGPLYLPEATGEVVTRPAATPAEPAPAPAPDIPAVEEPKKEKGASPPPE